jgi:ABC-type uncharacterized transport system permease subunit
VTPVWRPFGAHCGLFTFLFVLSLRYVQIGGDSNYLLPPPLQYIFYIILLVVMMMIIKLLSSPLQLHTLLYIYFDYFKYIKYISGDDN